MSTPAPQGLTTITITCAHCGQTDHTISVEAMDSAGELELFKAAEPEARQLGWALRGKPGSYEWVCPLCVDRERNRGRLPAFSGLSKRCPMCQGRPVSAKYERAGGDHLRRACGTCGYAWNEATARRKWWQVWR